MWMWYGERCSYPCAHHEGKQGSEYVTPLILNLDTRGRTEVVFTPRPLYPSG